MSQDLIKALERLMRHFPTDSDMAEAGWTAQEIEAACVAHEAASAALSRHRSSVESVELPKGDGVASYMAGTTCFTMACFNPADVKEGDHVYTASTVRSLIAAAVEREREECAKVCDAEDVADSDFAPGVQECIAAAIRARGEK